MTTFRIAAAGLALMVFTAACGDQDRDTDIARDDEAGISATEFRAAMNDLRVELRSTLDQFGAQIAELDERYMSTNEELAEDWRETREEIRSYRETLEADLARLETASEDEAEGLTDDIASDLEELTQRVERAHLKSVESSEEFIAASRDRLSRLEQDFRALEQESMALTMEEREDVSESMQDFSRRADEIRTQLDQLADATAEEISDERDDIAEDISSLTASVKRELFETRQSTARTSMR